MNKEENEKKIVIIQKWFRGCMLRIKRLPFVLYKIQKYLKNTIIPFSQQTEDGRINSCLDEKIVIQLLLQKFKIKIPKIRMWYDILVYDFMIGWIPVNIKTTTTKTCDNTGNLAMCVYAYTDENLNIFQEKTYENGEMSEILFQKLKEKKYNRNHKKDYYFIVLNKQNKTDIIINSVKGLVQLTSNCNNLPFQVNWSKNRSFQYQHINHTVKLFVECLQKSKPSWKETFMQNMRSIKPDKIEQKIEKKINHNKTADNFINWLKGNIK